MADADEVEFWIVMGLFEQRLPRRVYESANDARAAARRLSTANPGVYFFTLKTIGVFYQDPEAVVEKPTKVKKVAP